MIFDYTLIDHPTVRLTLAESEGGWYSVIDQTGRLYFPPTRDLTTCMKFMLAMASKKDAVLDEESIIRATWTEQHSVKVAAPGLRGDPDMSGASGEGNEPDTGAAASLPDNVRPIRLAR